MIVKPKVKDFICLTAHPEGCREGVRQQIQYIQKQPLLNTGQRTLVIGSSTGYGLSSRICATYADCAPTLGICYEKPATANRTATSGWYQSAAFEQMAHRDGFYAKTINGDAFSAQVKQEAVSMIRRDLEQIDLLVYSVAAPRRVMPDGSLCTSVLKTTGQAFCAKSLDLEKHRLTEKTVLPADQSEIDATVNVMGGQDWKDWVDILSKNQLLSSRFHTVAYSYIGPEMTYPIYAEGTIGRAKDHLYQTALKLSASGFPAYVSVNKAVVTQSSSAIPIVPLYISILYQVMKQAGSHENTIQQMYRLWNSYQLNQTPITDIPHRIRLDDWEMDPAIQNQVKTHWNLITDQTLEQYADITGYWKDFYQLFGFEQDHVSYDSDVDIQVPIPSIPQS